MGERMLTRLMQTYAMLLQASTAYRKAFEEALTQGAEECGRSVFTGT